LECTKELNDKLKKINGGGTIYPVQLGLGSSECELEIDVAGGSSSFVLKGDSEISERIRITTLDAFVESNGIERIDFIKADIEGAERDMLKGATRVLRDFAPKLAICTYHLPDDPAVLEGIIKSANPGYKVVHLRHKLFACVVKK
jgi:FkbM family methyltransferase